MKKLAITMGAIAFLTMPALSASGSADRPLVVADSGVSVHVGDRDDHDRDRDRHHVVVIHKHHDEDHDRHHVIVVHHKEHHDHDDDRR